ncbi:MAG: hypothetical protein IJS44_06760, partial [Clostridia bacterium]|nr:hypothetical protein [Clostridia bacterium]
FLGWSTTAGGSVRFEDAQSVKNIAENSTVTLYAVFAKDLYNIDGVVKSAHTGDITLELVQGNHTFGEQKTVAYTTANEETEFALKGVPAGTYNLIAKQGEVTMTVAVIITDDHVELGTITMPTGDTSSVINIEGESTPAVVVSGLDDAAAAEEIDSRKVTVTITIEAQNEAQTGEGGKAILEESRAQKADFIDFTVTKTIYNNGNAESVETLTETKGLLELIVPFDFSGKRSINLYRYHNGQVELLTEAKGAAADGTYKFDRQSGLIYVYTNSFSVYAVTYGTSSSGGSSAGGAVINDTFPIVIEKTANGKVVADNSTPKTGEKVTVTVTPDDGYTVDTVTATDAKGNTVTVT